MTVRREALEVALVRLRDPLSRIQLAASELADHATVGDSLGRRIEHAVAEIDLRIEDALTGLRRGRRGARPDGDIRESLALVVRDLGPILAARGIELALAPLPDAPVYGDASLVRRTVCRLFLGIGHWVRTRTALVRIELGDRGEPARIQLVVEAHGGEAHGASFDLLDPARELALGEGISIDGTEDAEGGRAVLNVDFGRGLAS